MSVEAIVRVVEGEAEAEAARIVGAARERAEALVRAARAEADDRVRAACDRARPGMQAEATRAVNEARVAALESRADLAAELVAAVMARAAHDLAAIAAAPGEGRWQRASARLVAESARGVGPGGVVLVRPDDLASAAPIAAAAGCRAEAADLGTSDARGLGAGAIGRSADGRLEIDATLGARLDRARVVLAEPVARSLGVEA